VKGFNLISEKAYAAVGRDWSLQDDNIKIIEKCVCHLYGKTKLQTVNAARQEIFKQTYKIDETLPPNRDPQDLRAVDRHSKMMSCVQYGSTYHSLRMPS
jgi:hypothetical protein